MNHETTSLWMSGMPVPELPPLIKDTTADVCIVGAGIAGLTTAYLLLKSGKSVCVLEDTEIASGQSGRTTAQFSTCLDLRYFELQKLHGWECNRLIAESHKAAIALVTSIVKEEDIDCDLEFVDGYLFRHEDSELNILDEEFNACIRAGLTEVTLEESSPVPTLSRDRCLRFEHQMQLHPVKYLSALAKIIIAKGGEIYTRTHVQKIEGGSDAKVTTSDGKVVSCKSILVATNSPINDMVAIHTKQAPYRTYVIAMTIPKDSVPRGLFWDTQDPYHYVRVEPGFEHDKLIVGGEDHKTGQEHNPEERFRALEYWTRSHFPMVSEVKNKWSGQVLEPVDGIAYMGRNPLDHENVFVITGHSGNGMTYSTVGAMIVRDQILGVHNPWEKLYRPSRVNLKAAAEYLKENSNVAAQYADWIFTKDHLNGLFPEQGIVVRDGLKLVAVYKDSDGELTTVSAACPHLKGVVRWNSVEKSWDCPCHGSRFDSRGKVIEGPAFSDLKPVALSTPQTTNPNRPDEKPSTTHPVR